MREFGTKIRRQLALPMLAAGFAYLLGSSAVAKAGQSVPTAEQTAGQAYKNVQVLKDIPADQLIPTMQFVAASLGVECGYCHVRGAFDKDDKRPKQMARKMIRMVLTINKQTFGSQKKVTCYSCHRGSTKPLSIPPVVSERLTAPSDATKSEGNSSLPNPEQVIDRYVKALGGRAAIAGVSSRIETGWVTLFGRQKYPLTIATKMPDKQSTVMRLPGGESITSFNGQSGWMSFPGRPVTKMSASEEDGARLDADLHLGINLKDAFTGLRSKPAVAIDHKQANLVVGVRQGEPPVELYFDQGSGLLVRMVRYIVTALGDLPVQIDYADYRDVSGVKVPFRWTVSRPNLQWSFEIEQVRQNVPIKDSEFAKPEMSSGMNR